MPACFGGLLLLALVAPARAQTSPPAWDVALSGNNSQPGTTGTSFGRASAVDAAGNVFVTGYFTGTVSFGLTRLTSAGNADVFVARWDAAARAFTWATRGGGTGNDYGYGIAVEGTGVYVTGAFDSNTNVSLAGQALAGAGGTDAFVAKYLDTSAGSTPGFANGWATSAGGTGADVGYGVAVRGTGVYLTGQFASGTGARFAGQPLAGASGSDAFVAKYLDTSIGSTQSFANGWATSAGGSGADGGYGIAASSAGIFVTGSFGSNTNATIAGQPLPGAGSTDAFVAKYVDTSAGGTQSFANGWATSGGGAGFDAGSGVAVSGANVYVTGQFATSASPRFAGRTLVGAGGFDAFVAKYVDTSGGSTQSFANGWATSAGGTDTDVGLGLAVSGAGIYVAGSYTSATGFSAAGQALAGAGGTDAFVAKYLDTSAGGTQSVADGWASSGGGAGFDAGSGVAVSGAGVFAAGTVGNALASFGAAPATVYAPANSALLGRLDPATGAWAQADGPLQGGTSETRGVATDARGNAFVTGSFSGAVGFGPTRLVSGGFTDVFVAKWDATAQAFTWATGAGGISIDEGSAIAVSGANVYVTGSFTSNRAASFAGQALAGAGIDDAFVAKYIDTSTGSTPATSSFANGWALSAGGTGSDGGEGIAVSGTGVFVTGAFGSASRAIIAGQALTGAGSGDVFVAKYIDTSTGSTQSVANGWATSAGGTGADYGQGIALSGTGVFVLGSFTSNRAASVAGQALTGAGLLDIFVAKYVDAGSTVANGWATSGGGTGNDTAFGQDIAVSGADVYVTGTFATASAARFAGQALAEAGGNDVFVAKYLDTSTGSTPGFANGWATSAGGTGGDGGYGIAVEGPNVYVTGIFTSGTGARFAGQALAGAGSGDVFLARYVDAGPGSAPGFANGWATSGGGTGGDVAYGMAVGGGQVYVAGSVNPPATFGSIAFGNATSGFINFLGRVAAAPLTPLPVRAAAAGAGAAGLRLYPNPAPGGAATLVGTAPGAAVTVYDALGRAVASATANAAGTAALRLPAGLPAGVYVVRAGPRALRLTLE